MVFELHSIPLHPLSPNLWSQWSTLWRMQWRWLKPLSQWSTLRQSLLRRPKREPLLLWRPRLCWRLVRELLLLLWPLTSSCWPLLWWQFERELEREPRSCWLVRGLVRVQLLWAQSLTQLLKKEISSTATHPCNDVSGVPTQ